MVPRLLFVEIFLCWQPRRSCRQGVQLPHSCPATRAWTSDYWNGADIACSVILSRIDYCSSLLYGAPVAVVEKLQRAQNNVARVTCQQRRCVHARPLLQSLHWLPVQQRKIAVITHKALSTSVPPYIDELLYSAKWRRGLCGPPMLCVSLCRGHALRQSSKHSV